MLSVNHAREPAALAPVFLQATGDGGDTKCLIKYVKTLIQYSIVIRLREVR
jgi:hypothetical protein